VNERDLFIAAVQIEDPAARSAHLDTACGGDAELRQRVDALLAAFAQAGSFLHQAAANAAATADVPPAGPSPNGAPAEGPGTIIGPYKLLQQIGEGGMGTVFMAEQTHPVQRKVALKLIKSGMDSRQVMARFEAERQALALMDHPNIAKVLDAGTTDRSPHAPREGPPLAEREGYGGRPYFVMELVKGVPITKYCDEHRLTPRQRLELFVPVCQAVQHAHQKGIIHRDLKPSNVMVCLYDGKPVPKVIDFGVAKATGQKLTELTMFTEIGQVVGTLEYMSPEQAELNQLDIDTRSDIYSLGVLLYELLTGTTPLERKRLKEVAFLEVLRLIREEETPRPSTRLSTTEGLPSIAANRGLEPKKLSGLVRGELDWMVMKTLEKDRNRRYETANGLAMDVQRYLADEAVQACPPSASYRLRKFVRRHKGPVLAGTVIILLLIGGIVGTTLGLLQAQTSEEHAQGEAIKAGQERDQADAARAAAQTAGEAEKVQRELAEERGKELRQNLYFAEMNLAGQAAESPLGLARVAELLSHWPSGQPDLRGWEWFYLHGLCHQDLLTISFAPAVGTKVWDAVTGKEAVILVGSRTGGYSVGWSPDGKLLASGAWSPDGKLLASETEAPPFRMITVWDAVTGKQRLTYRGEMYGYFGKRSIAWAPDGTRLASSADYSRTVKVSDARTGKTTLILKGHTTRVESVAWSRDGKRLASADKSGTVKIWDGATGNETLQIRACDQLQTVSWSPDGSRLASAGPSGSIGCMQIWDTASAKQLLFSTTGVPMYSVSWSPDGKRLAWGTSAGQVEIADAATGKAMVTLRGHSDGVGSVAWSPDGTRLASASNDGIKVWAADQKEEPLRLQAPNPRNAVDSIAVAWSPNGKRLASVGLNLRIWDVTTGKEFLTKDESAHSAAWNPDGTRLASTAGGPVKIWDAATGKELLTLKTKTHLDSVAWSPDGIRLAAAGQEGVLIWDPIPVEQTGNPRLISPSGGPWTSLSWSPDGTRLAGATFRGAVQIWNAATGEPTCILEGHMSWANWVAWCPAGKRLASVSRDRTVKIWDATTGKEILTLRGHTAQVSSVSWSPDGTRLASVGGDGVKIWDPITGKELITFRYGGIPSSVAWSPDGLRLATSWPILIFDAANGYRLVGRSAPGKRRPDEATALAKP